MLVVNRPVTACSPLGCFTACVVYGRFDSKTNRTANSIRDSIRTKKHDSQVPNTQAIRLLLCYGTTLSL